MLKDEQQIEIAEFISSRVDGTDQAELLAAFRSLTESEWHELIDHLRQAIEKPSG